MKNESSWPNPVWVDGYLPGADRDSERQRFVLRIAAIYHNRSGSLGELSKALGYSNNALHQAATQGGVTPECAVKLEALLGRERFPRELFRPDIFQVA